MIPNEMTPTMSPEQVLEKLPPRLRVKLTQRGDCLIWTGGKKGKGYGVLSLNGRRGRAHVVIYEALVGPVPEGLQLDHLCRTRLCIWPGHQEPVTCRENLMRGNTIAACQAAKSHCIRGHPFDGVNTYRAPNGTRKCRACRSQQRSPVRGRRPALEMAHVSGTARYGVGV